MLLAASDPRGWLLSQPQLLVVLFAGAVWLFNRIARARTSASGPAGAPQGTRPPEPAAGGPSDSDPGDEDRARLVRAEILRKIAERRAPQPASNREERRSPGPTETPRTVQGGGRGLIQAVVPEGLAAVQPRAAVPGTPKSSVPAGAAAPTGGALWLEEMRSRDTARRAIVVREILGPPVALR